MSQQTLTNREIELFLLANQPIEIVNEICFVPPTLLDVLKYKEYSKDIEIALLQKEQFMDALENESKEFSTFDFIIASCIHRENFATQICKILFFFTKQTFIFYETVLVHINQNENASDEEKFYIFSKLDWELITRIIAVYNGTTLEQLGRKAKKRIFADDKAAEIAKKIEANKALVNKFKKESNSTMFDEVSAFCAKSTNINIFEVWKLNLVQYRNQLQDLINIENYDKQLSMALAGAKVDNMTHWLNKKREEN